jgi:hypothetical protein
MLRGRRGCALPSSLMTVPLFLSSAGAVSLVGFGRLVPMRTGLSNVLRMALRTLRLLHGAIEVVGPKTCRASIH